MDTERERRLVGEVTHFFGKIGVGVVHLQKPLNKGDDILIEGASTHIVQKAQSMQYNHRPLDTARPGLDIGLKVKDRVREKDKVFVLAPLAAARISAKPSRRPAAKKKPSARSRLARRARKAGRRPAPSMPAKSRKARARRIAVRKPARKKQVKKKPARRTARNTRKKRR